MKSNNLAVAFLIDGLTVAAGAALTLAAVDFALLGASFGVNALCGTALTLWFASVVLALIGAAKATRTIGILRNSVPLPPGDDTARARRARNAIVVVQFANWATIVAAVFTMILLVISGHAAINELILLVADVVAVEIAVFAIVLLYEWYVDSGARRQFFRWAYAALVPWRLWIKGLTLRG